MPRDDFTVKVKQSLRERVGGYCSNPDCMAATTGPARQNESSVVSIGVAAHIHAASQGGPRFDATMNSAQRSSIENGIWLCANCASLIDKNGGLDYSVTVLKEWKARAESEADKRLSSGAMPLVQRWHGRLNSIIFCNVPRVIQRLDLYNQEVEIVSGLSDGFPKGYIAPYLAALEACVRSIEIDAFPIDLIGHVDDQLVGSIVSFDASCRTKNSSAVIGRKVDVDLLTKFDVERSPHFYAKNSDGIVFRFPYDPKWVTTATAFSELRSGQAHLSGLGIIKRADAKNLEYIVSPLVIGHPRRSFHDAMGF